MAYAQTVMGAGFSAGQALAIGGGVASSITAAGTTQGTATALGKLGFHLIGTAAASTGVLLAAGAPGDSCIVFNGGANAVLVYPPTSAKINALATNAGVTLAPNTCCLFVCASATQWGANLSA